MPTARKNRGCCALNSLSRKDLYSTRRPSMNGGLQIWNWIPGFGLTVAIEQAVATSTEMSCKTFMNLLHLLLSD